MGRGKVMPYPDHSSPITHPSPPSTTTDQRWAHILDADRSLKYVQTPYILMIIDPRDNTPKWFHSYARAQHALQFIAKIAHNLGLPIDLVPAQKYIEEKLHERTE